MTMDYDDTERCGSCGHPAAMECGCSCCGTEDSEPAHPGAAFAIWHAWPVFLARYYVHRTWDDLPGPTWVKALLIVACVAIPGPADELALIGITRICRTWRAHRARTA
jgi:hypothetical protein